MWGFCSVKLQDMFTLEHSQLKVMGMDSALSVADFICHHWSFHLRRFYFVARLQWFSALISSWHNGNQFSKVINLQIRGTLGEATVLCQTALVSAEVLSWERGIERLLAAVIMFKMAACPAWVLCSVGKILMLSFHLDCSDRGLYWFLARWNHYEHKGASFSSSPSLFIKDLRSCCLFLESMKMSCYHCIPFKSWLWWKIAS